jgi:putative transposase
MAEHLRTELVLAALNMALGQRKPREIVHHSDHGTQYTSIAFGLRCKEAGVRPSMGTVGDAYDNAMCESFFATLECELLARRRFATKAEARMALFEFIEGWYNPIRRRTGLGRISPIQFERRHSTNYERATCQIKTSCQTAHILERDDPRWSSFFRAPIPEFSRSAAVMDIFGIT